MPRLEVSVPVIVPSDAIMRSAVDSSGPSGLVKDIFHFPVMSPLGGSLGFSGSRISKRWPSTNTSFTFGFFREQIAVCTLPGSRFCLFRWSQAGQQCRKSPPEKESVRGAQHPATQASESIDFFTALRRSFGLAVAPE